MAIDKKAAFEKSFAGYHKDAPAALKKASADLKKDSAPSSKRGTSDGYMRTVPVKSEGEPMHFTKTTKAGKVSVEASKSPASARPGTVAMNKPKK